MTDQWVDADGTVRLTGTFVGGGSQICGPYTMTFQDVADNLVGSSADVSLGFTPTVGDFILDVLVIITEAFDHNTSVDSASPSINIGADPITLNSIDLTTATAGTNLLNDAGGNIGTISTLVADLVQGSGAHEASLVAITAEAFAHVICDGDPPTVGSVDFYFLLATPTAP